MLDLTPWRSPAHAYSARILHSKEGESLSHDSPDALLGVDEKAMSAGFVISTIARDRVGDIMLPEGCKDSLADYARTAGVFFSHDTKRPPVALCLKDGALDLVIGRDRIVSRAYFHGKTRESDEVFALVASGVLKGASIGFVPLEAMRIEAAEAGVRGLIDFDFGGFVFVKWALTEWSVVPVPCNAEAVRHAIDHVVKSALIVRKLLPHAAFPKGTVRVEKGMHKGMLEDLVAGPGQGGVVPLLPQYEDHFRRNGDQPQAILFATSLFPEEGDASQWLQAAGIEAQRMEREDLPAGDPDPNQPAQSWFCAEIFECDLCEAGSVRTERLEDGVIAVFCKPKPAEGENARSLDTSLAKTILPMADNPAETAPLASDAPAAIPAAEDKSLGTPEAPPPVPKQEASPEPLPGARALKSLVKMAEGLEAECKAHDAQVEQSSVKRAIAKVVKLAGKAKFHCCRVGCKVYPDQFEEPKAMPESSSRTKEAWGLDSTLAFEVQDCLAKLADSPALAPLEKAYARSLSTRLAALREKDLEAGKALESLKRETALLGVSVPGEAASAAAREAEAKALKEAEEKAALEARVKADAEQLAQVKLIEAKFKEVADLCYSVLGVEI